MGINLDVYQNAESPFFRKYNGMNVIGMPIKKLSPSWDERFFIEQSENYRNITRFNSQLHIYSAFEECYPYVASPSIGISHGISWDGPQNSAWENIETFGLLKFRYIKSAELCDKLVSVDTNTANWFQTIDYEIGNKKFSVIPNYVDVEKFKPREDFLNTENKIQITYPRRLYEPRGLYLVLNIAGKIIEKYPNVEFHFVGKGFDEDITNVQKAISKYPENIFCYSRSPFDMHEVYKNTDISLIPTLYSEGTSLSCLEAMASGNCVVANRVGGLTDLIINGYNGYLIEPNEDSMYETLDYILSNYNKVNSLKKCARETAIAFSKSIWKQRWKKVLSAFDLVPSKNNELIEFYLESVESINDTTYKLIKEELNNNNLVYLKCENANEKEKIEGQLLQVIEIDEEVVSLPTRIYATRKLAQKYRINKYYSI